jgi:hypothetical protein
LAKHDIFPHETPSLVVSGLRRDMHSAGRSV